MRKWMLVAGAVVLGSGLLTGMSRGPAAAAVSPPSAHVWVTTPDGSQRMTDGGQIPFQVGGSASLTVTVDPSRAYQRMDGFGASITDSSAHVLYRLDRSSGDAAMRDLFSPTDGDGLSLLRQPMGASDFVDGPHYTYDDLPPGQHRLRHAPLLHRPRRKQILPLLRQALALNPTLKVIATPWSPPAWMKTNDSLDRRPAHRRPPHLPGVRAVLREVRPGLPARPACRSTRSRCRTSRRTGTRTATPAPTCRSPRRPSSSTRSARRCSGRACTPRSSATTTTGPSTRTTSRQHPPGEDPETDYPFDLLHSQRRALVRWHRVPLLLRRPDPADRAAQRFPGQGDLVHRVLRLARRRLTRPRRSSPTR